MDPEIQHLIDTLWEVDNCPPPLFGEINLKVTSINHIEPEICVVLLEEEKEIFDKKKFCKKYNRILKVQ